MDELTYEQYKVELEKLNEEKHLLERKTNVLDGAMFAKDFLLLAGKYAAIGARANQSFCMDRYYHYSDTKPENLPVEHGESMLEAVFAQTPFVPEPEFVDPPEVDEPEYDHNWQGRADVGD